MMGMISEILTFKSILYRNVYAKMAMKECRNIRVLNILYYNWFKDII